MPSRTYSIPERWEPCYTDDDKNNVIEIISWLNNSTMTARQLSIKASSSNATLSQLLHGKYPSSPTKLLEQLLRTIRLEDARNATLIDIPVVVETQLYKLIASAAHRARTRRMLACITALPGTGKTTAIMQYAAGQPDVFIVDTMPGMHAVPMLESLVEQTGARSLVRRTSDARFGTRDQMAIALVKTLRGTNSLIIVDEAESATPSAIEFIRKICNQAKIGGMLIGDEELFANLHNRTRQHDKTRSRFCLFPDTVRHLSRADSDALAKAYLHDHLSDVNKKVLDALWECSAGSARVLCDTLISAVRDFGIAQGHKLTPALIYQINSQVLNYSDRISVERQAKVQPAQQEQVA